VKKIWTRGIPVKGGESYETISFFLKTGRPTPGFELLGGGSGSELGEECTMSMMKPGGWGVV